MSKARQISLVLLAVALAAIPVLSAWDDGGGHRWTQANATKAILALVVFGLGLSWNLTAFRPPLLTQLAMLIWLISGLQCVPLPPSLVETLSPASHEAYRGWLTAEVRKEVLEWPDAPGVTEASRAFPVSVAPHLTRQALSIPLTFAAGCWLASICYQDRRAAWILLGVPVLAGTVFCFFGSVDMIRLNRDWNVELRQRLLITPIGANGPFGPFINNNTCIGYINLCLGCVLGILYATWFRSKSTRAARATRMWLSGLAFIFTAVMVMGVLASNSRGGFLGMCFATMILALVSLRHLRFGWLLLFIVLGFGSIQLVDGLGIREEMEARLTTLTDGTASKNPRLRKWEDGLTAALAHLPMGSGLGTYRYAQLPHGSNAVERWAVNADGMHVEWLLEGGIWLLPLIILGVLILIKQMIRIARSLDHHPLAQARLIRATTIAAGFSIASLLVTQSFDFGITHIPLILTIAILAGGVSHLDRQRDEIKESDTPPANGMTLGNFAIGTFLAGALLCAASDLDAGAVWQRIMIQRHAERNLPIQDRLMDFDEEIQRVRDTLTIHPLDAMGHRVMASLLLDRQHQIGCQTLVRLQAADPNAAHEWSIPMNVRRAAHENQVDPETVMLEGQDIQQWRLARQHAASALALSPLDDATRVLMVETDFLDPARSQSSETLLLQAARLRPRTPSIIKHLSLLSESFPGIEIQKAILEIEKDYQDANVDSVITQP